MLRALFTAAVLAVAIRPAVAAVPDAKSPAAEPSVLDFALKVCQDEYASTALNDPRSTRDAQRTALANVFGNAMEAALDGPNIKSDGRCFIMSWFDKFAKDYYLLQFGDRIFEHRAPLVEWQGERGVIDCPRVMSMPAMLVRHPEFAVLGDNSPETHAALASELVDRPDELKRKVNSYLGPSLTNGPKLRVEDVSPDPERPDCLSVKAVSRVEDGGYGYGRVFRFCRSPQDSGCGKYFELQ